jgi:hypothetical protein
MNLSSAVEDNSSFPVAVLMSQFLHPRLVFATELENFFKVVNFPD